MFSPCVHFFYIYELMYVCRYMHATAFVWGLKDNLWISFLLSLCGSWRSNSGHQFGGKCLYLLNYLPVHYAHFLTVLRLSLWNPDWSGTHEIHLPQPKIKGVHYHTKLLCTSKFKDEVFPVTLLFSQHMYSAVQRINHASLTDLY